MVSADNLSKRVEALEKQVRFLLNYRDGNYTDPEKDDDKDPELDLVKIRLVGPDKFKMINGLTLVPLAKIIALADCAHSLTELRERLHKEMYR